MTLADEQAVGHSDAERAHVVVRGKLVVRQGLHQHTTRRVRHTDEIQIALQHTILTRSPVNRDIAKVGTNAPPRSVSKREVIAVHHTAKCRLPLARVKQGIPLTTVNLHQKRIITL